MATSKLTAKVEKLLGTKITNDGDQAMLIKQQTLRRLVGILGMLLPLFVYFNIVISYGDWHILPAISHYYFTSSSVYFIIIISTLAIFLLIYKDKDPLDFYLSCGAGIFALCVLIFPTNNIVPDCAHNTKAFIITFLPDNNTRSTFHFIAAAVFLLCLDLMSFFLFTRSKFSPENRTQMKKWRNRVYRTCSLLMTLALIVPVLNKIGWIPDSYYDAHNLTFWVECVAIESFGISWLVKSEAILKG